MNLETKYLGLTLAHPFMVGASPLADHLDTVKRLEDSGSAAIVLRSLFEEQITMAESARIHHMDPLDPEFAVMLATFPRPDTYPLSPERYLEHVRRVKDTVRIPVIASLNGMTGESWASYARNIEQAGADALELNIYEMATDPDESGLAIEARIRDLVLDLKRAIRIPIAVKLGPFFTAFGHMARQLDQAGADGLVIFNRFYQPDIDVTHLATIPRIELSTSAEMLLRLRWLSALHGRVRCSLAVSGRRRTDRWYQSDSGRRGRGADGFRCPSEWAGLPRLDARRAQRVDGIAVIHDAEERPRPARQPLGGWRPLRTRQLHPDPSQLDPFLALAGRHQRDCPRRGTSTIGR